MEYKQTSNLVLFINSRAGQPALKNGKVVEYNGKQITESDFNGKITLPEGLPAGEYEVKIYKRQSKAGKPFFSGNIKPAFKKIDQHSQDKSNGYQKDSISQDYDLNDEVPW